VCALTVAGCGEQPLGPEDIWASNTALVAVDAGTLVRGTESLTNWGQLRQGRTLTVTRDNPPIWGYIPFTGTVRGTPLTAGPTVNRHDTRMAHSYLWDTNDFRFSGTADLTPTDELNPSGLREMGIAPVGPFEPGHIRYHTNGLRLTPGSPATIGLERSVGFDQWEPYTNQSAAGALVLDPRTAVVPVQILLVDDPNDTRQFVVSEALAQLWVDGRTVDRLSTTYADGRLQGVYVQDRDARPNYQGDQHEPWGPDETAGRTLGPLNQHIDEVWCQCAFFDHNIQFRLVNFEHVPSASPRTPVCTHPDDIPNGFLSEDCVRDWTAAARHTPSGLHPLTLAFVHSFVYQFADADSFPAQNGTIVSDTALFGDTTGFAQHVLAHELGHLLGGTDNLFSDYAINQAPHPNLMRKSGPVLTADQCAIAYEKAKRLAMFPVAT
jgi:hypothetical protein